MAHGISILISQVPNISGRLRKSLHSQQIISKPMIPFTANGVCSWDHIGPNVWVHKLRGTIITTYEIVSRVAPPRNEMDKDRPGVIVWGVC